MFPGQGSQYVNMAAELYRSEPTFRGRWITAAEILGPHLGLDLRGFLYPADHGAATRELLEQTAVTQPALFAVEYALATLWMEWGCGRAQ